MKRVGEVNKRWTKMRREKGKLEIEDASSKRSSKTPKMEIKCEPERRKDGQLGIGLVLLPLILEKF